MKKCLEQPLKYLRRNDGSEFSETTISNWYKARAFVLDKLGDVAFEPDSGNHLHVVVKGDDELMLSVVRQVALSAHYINFDEDDDDRKKSRRTVITLESGKENIYKELEAEEYLGNLPRYCINTIYGKSIDVNSAEGKNFIDIKNSIDIEINIVDKYDESEKENVKIIEKDEVISFCNSKFEEEIFSIDTRKAQYAGRMYELGAPIENLPSENIHDAHRYTMALDVYQYQKLQLPLGKLVDESKWKEAKNRIKVKNGMSNLFCADCFETREREINAVKESALGGCKTKDERNKIKKENYWEKYNEALSKSEHARWVVEKLIMGFRPLDDNELIKDETLSPYKKKRKQYRDGLKKCVDNPVHIDLCSYNDLRRTNPDDMKYDSFLMLAIPTILEKIRRDG